MSIADLYRTMGPVGPIEPRLGATPDAGALKPGEISEFEKVLLQHNAPVKQESPAAESGLKFSSHAETRIKSRSIQWNEDLERRVSGGIDSAREKGSRETLILAGNVAVIANVKSRTVITAMDAANLKERIFTNIDSAVIV
jgi:flagellar operon protein